MNYYVKTLKGEGGPFSLEQMHELIAKGHLTHHHYIRLEGSEEWVQAYTVDGMLIEQSEFPQKRRMDASQSRTSHGGAGDIPPALLPDDRNLPPKPKNDN